MNAASDRASVSGTMGDARAMLAKLSEQWGKPLTAGIEISDRCNEVCVHCYQEQGRKGEMTTEQLFRVMDELASMGVLLLTLAGGEATLRKDFLELVRYARQKAFAVRIFTNGLTMSRAMAAALRELAVQSVEISLYSTQPATHDFVTGVPGSFEKTVQGVRNLVEVGVSVMVKTPVMTVNAHELGEYAAFAQSLGAEHVFDLDELTPREGGSRAPEAFQISTRTKRELRHALNAVKPGADAKPLDEAPCNAAQTIHIEPNGELRPCTSLEFDLGHALHEGVTAAHTSNERALAIRGLTWASLHGCRDCDLRRYCRRCYASALAQTGDALGPYPSACATAGSAYEAHLDRVLRMVRPSQTGPYREVADGVFEAVPDVVTADDDALAARLGWARRESVAVPSTPARPGELVQIRRPGRKKMTLERIPIDSRPKSNVEVAREKIESDTCSTAS